MPEGILEFFELGVSYHSFTDGSGTAVYSKFSNEAFVVTISVNELAELIANKGTADARTRHVREELFKKGFIKKEWH